MKLSSVLAALFVVCFSSSSAAFSQPDLQPLFNEDTIASEAVGIWESPGYGWVASISDNELKLYHHTDAGCMADPATTEELAYLATYFAREETRLWIAARAQGATVYPFVKIDAIPADCFESFEDTNRAVFDYFWSVMDRQYAFFDVYGVDWDARRTEYVDKVSEEMDDKELFELLSDMMEGLNDGHLELHAEINGENERFRASRTRVFGSVMDTAFAHQKKIKDRGEFSNDWFWGSLKRMKKKVLKKSYRSAAGGNIVWGKIGRIGYVTVFGMGEFDDDNEGFDFQIAAVHRIMNQVINDLEDTEGLIFDVALNQGGMDEISLALASHFTKEPVFAYSKVAREAGVDPQRFYVEPAESGHYLKPVTLVTSDITVSAAEIFTMAMRSLPTVTHAGDTTWGALSDILSKTLPNGWELEMSNEIYKDANGVLWEGKGIPPTTYVQLFDPYRIHRSRSEALVRIAEEMMSK